MQRLCDWVKEHSISVSYIYFHVYIQQGQVSNLQPAPSQMWAEYVHESVHHSDRFRWNHHSKTPLKLYNTRSSIFINQWTSRNFITPTHSESPIPSNIFHTMSSSSSLKTLRIRHWIPAGEFLFLAANQLAYQFTLYLILAICWSLQGMPWLMFNFSSTLKAIE